MDPITIAPLAISAWTLLEPYAKKLGGKLVEKAGESLPDVVDKVWDTVKTKMESKPETKNLPTDLAKAPNDEDVQGAFKYQLKKLLENDAVFAKQLNQLVEEAKQTMTLTAEMKGDGAIAQGENAVAVGKGGINIGGSVSGSNIVTGNSNVINSEEKRKKKK